jgi:PilZ domain
MGWAAKGGTLDRTDASPPFGKSFDLPILNNRKSHVPISRRLFLNLRFLTICSSQQANTMSERRNSPRFQDAKLFPLVEGMLELKEGTHWPVTFENLSLEGALLIMPEWRALSLAQGMEIHVKLMLKDKIIWGRGTIQHVQSGLEDQSKTSKVGVLFEEIKTKDGKNSKHILGEMVRALDRYQLRQRAALTSSE